MEDLVGVRMRAGELDVTSFCGTSVQLFVLFSLFP